MTTTNTPDTLLNSLDVATAISEGGRDGTLSFPGKPMEPVLVGSIVATPEPERLFAGAYAACFQGALLAVAGKLGIPLSGAILEAKVALVEDKTGGKRLVVELHACVPGIEREQTRQLMEEAHKICPYSKALRGDATVELIVD
jgi:osmotically inducible protein OsmC